MDKNKISDTRRKLQFAGNSSYVLTIPKSWIVSQNLDNKDSEVLIQELSDSTLRISPVDMGDKADLSETYRILIDSTSNEDEIIRNVLAGYLASKNEIIIQSKKKEEMINPRITLAVTNLVTKLWGSEITAETSSNIIIQDALDPTSMPIDEIISKSWIIAKNMLDQAFEALFEANETSKQTVENSENTLDKLYYLALRQLYKASSNFMFASEIGIKPRDIIDYHLLIKNIERIGDHCTQLVESFGEDFENKKQIIQLSDQVKQSANLSIEAFKKLDEETAQLAISQKDIILDVAAKINFKPNEFPLQKSLLRISDYSADIGELVINKIVSSERSSLLF